ncbi:mechanosensitive ion channel family protein [Pseudoalteromonas phenolica]|uniref:Mechanosensitive ion channel protein n=1 Tax=Pseudoalteromonas phenolica TaxID=161398 RepID=A0A0S2K769_9GAMM|nr:mechanosensitive ion channel domain-containing protein [Pseudoalteromonas phenolica]ALO44166.1 Mechanosensitive ion channel protein [Pseudoalteromonas phenolica]MBE0357154.1 potassium efflux system protein [Pseudoalteromonas phenolica O-BC30]TMO56353.1 mechanosensitive ion channel protein [Pseudoalteromonas phenolica]
MLAQISALLNYTIFTFNEEPLTVGEILIVPFWLFVSFWLVRFAVKSVEKQLKAKQRDPNIIQLVRRIIVVVSLAVIFLTTLSMLNVPITAFAFLSGAIAIGFGFGAQNIINNFISGWILIGEKPIRIGDFLEVEGVKGIVEEINTRSTRIRRVDGVHMLIPNSKLLENTVVNWTLRDRLVRGTVRVGVAYGSDCELVAKLMIEATKGHDNVLADPEPSVFFLDFGDNSLVFESYFWINSSVEGGLRLVSSDIRFALDKAFKDAGIVIAFPQRDIHIDGELKITK